MFSDFPITGVGYGNYGSQYLDYQTQVPGATTYHIKQRSSHSTYISLLAEGGLVGLAIWLGVLVVTWRLLKTARSVLASETASGRFLLVQALTYSFLLQSLYGWSLTVHQDKFFWMILGLSVAVDALVRQSVTPPLPQSNGFSSELVSSV
jgi:O-antigen ligase